MKLQNNIIVLETIIDDKILAQIKALKNEHLDKVAVIKECESSIRKNHPEIEIFEVGSTYLITESRMYLALFEDEIEIT